MGIGQMLKIACAGVIASVAVASAAGAQQGGDYGTYGGAYLDWLSPLAISSYEWPFKHGPISVIAPGANGAVQTYTLVPCQDGAAVCSGSAIGAVSVDGLTTVVSGLYGRTFYLGMGGHGVIDAGGVQSVLAWDTQGNGPNR
ncbi:hypothetical protein [Ketogulonicigenium vulgare]|uniref:Uncharacterized protein n=2 Tax=Ketogulonicigenium vulgare TaxID=92945 RepID=F9Y4C7_KETVW|nr:hypothetical protein [Ketogulonicigenium vulgare]ADO43458.1 conserved hypothetical protein [Ketogulonicigenium vulgare Y25]AEM41740.1 hypothetical protein KVU_1901 [Ketogulonicigenium vulgare WSH-001]ALJ81848.1 hypothetical protein KVH_12160 [Ketogulonicigenium vulgare]ANW34502.1 hypothetical protein KvSKV_12075 [Ketogulonicigenium vulgare]AOZ55494.1 hypothetical protein KVC_2492 [Ketogulonicigenium vulgare]